MQRNNAIVFEVIESNDILKQMFKWYLSHNTSLSVPYHNLNHTLGMMQIIIDMSFRSRKEDFGFVIDNEGMFILLVSAMFHDFNHSAGKFSDSVNVKNAISGMIECSKTLNMNDIERENLMKVCSQNIYATEYPYTIDDSLLNLYQRILREADILVVLYDDFITQCVYGLIDEMRQQDQLMFLSKYTKFLLDSVSSFKLSYSISVFNENKDRFLKEIESFYKLFKS